MCVAFHTKSTIPLRGLSEATHLHQVVFLERWKSFPSELHPRILPGNESLKILPRLEVSCLEGVGLKTAARMIGLPGSDVYVKVTM